jgi:hypothetical protein
MSSAPVSRLAAALALFFGIAPSARADWIPWTYSWSNSPNNILADNAAGGGRISLTNEATRSAVGDSDIVATNLRTYSTASPSAPDTVTNKPYTLTLNLTDTTSGQSGTAVFTGVFNGTLTATSANITNTFTGLTTAVLDLGDNRYTVTLNAYTPPGQDGSLNAGGIGARATVTVETVHIASTPEPGSLVLAACGLPLLALCLRRRRA